MRTDLNDLSRNFLTQLFEEAFNRMAPGGRMIRIPQIELHIRVPIEKGFTDGVLRSLKDEIWNQLQLLVALDSNPNVGSVKSNEKSVQQNQLHLLLHYLRTGTAHWFVLTNGIETELRETLREQRKELIAYLLIRTEPVIFYFRLLEILSHEEQIALIDSISQRIPSAPLQLILLLLRERPGELNRHARLKLAASFLQATLEAKRELPAVMDEMLEPAEKEALENLVSNSGMRLQDFILADPAVVRTKTPRASAFLTAESFELPAAAKQEPMEEQFPLTVSSAGLILLHPFLERFFENTNLREFLGMDPPSPDALARGAALLHFIATGLEEIHEWELGCIKILLGLDPQTPLAVSEGLLNSQDKEEAEVLLKAVIGHWSALKNTSIQGMRSSFLQREGLLYDKGHSWELHIENRAFDVLLNRLPWSISVIQLPWMRKAVYTEWRPV